MTYPIESIFQRLDKQLSGRLSRPGDKRYAAATAIWAKPVGPMPRALPKLDSQSIDVFIRAMASAAPPGCAIITHEFRGAASRVPAAATAFGLRRDHVLVEILASFTDRSEPRDEHWHQRWAQATRRAFDAMALPGGYPNFLASGEVERAAKSYGGNAERLIKAKLHYDPDNIFNSAIPLPARQRVLAAE